VRFGTLQLCDEHAPQSATQHQTQWSLFTLRLTAKTGGLLLRYNRKTQPLLWPSIAPRFTKMDALIRHRRQDLSCTAQFLAAGEYRTYHFLIPPVWIEHDPGAPVPR